MITIIIASFLLVALLIAFIFIIEEDNLPIGMGVFGATIVISMLLALEIESKTNNDLPAIKKYMNNKDIVQINYTMKDSILTPVDTVLNPKYIK